MERSGRDERNVPGFVTNMHMRRNSLVLPKSLHSQIAIKRSLREAMSFLFAPKKSTSSTYTIITIVLSSLTNRPESDSNRVQPKELIDLSSALHQARAACLSP